MTSNVGLFADVQTFLAVGLIWLWMHVQRSVRSVPARSDSSSPRSLALSREELTAAATATRLKWGGHQWQSNGIWWYLYAPSGAGIISDPHITTFECQCYTIFLRQGTFSLWHFCGVETDPYSDEIAGTKKLSVDCEGLVTWVVDVDLPLASLRPLFRLPVLHKGLRRSCATSAWDHFTGQWKARKGNEEWIPVDPVDNSEVISQMVSSTSQASTAGPWPVLMAIVFPTVFASCGPEPQLQAQAQPQCPKSPGTARASSRCRRTLNSARIANGKSLEEVNKQLGTFSYLMKLDHPLPCCNRTAWATETCSKHLGEAYGTGTENANLFEDCI